MLAAGTRLGPAELGAAVIAGRGEVRVSRLPRIAVVATGDELVPPGTPLQPGQIHESNSVTLGALARATGARPREYFEVTNAAAREAPKVEFGRPGAAAPAATPATPPTPAAPAK